MMMSAPSLVESEVLHQVLPASLSDARMSWTTFNYRVCNGVVRGMEGYQGTAMGYGVMAVISTS